MNSINQEDKTAFPEDSGENKHVPTMEAESRKFFRFRGNSKVNVTAETRQNVNSGNVIDNKRQTRNLKK